MSINKPEGNISAQDLNNEIERLTNQNDGTIDPLHNIPSASEVGKLIDAGPYQYDEIISNAEVFITDEFPDSEVLLVSSTPTGVSPVLTPGNISVISGKPKTCKTTFVGILIAALHAGYGYFNSRMTANRKGIVFIDFEMGARRTQNLARLICKMLNIEALPRHIRFYSLRKFDTPMRLSLLEHLAFHSPDVGVIFLDGIRDLVMDINSGPEVSKLMEKILNIVERTNVHLCSVIHTNKVDKNIRGVLGTELSNKCELSLTIDKKEDTGEFFYTVSVDLSRDIEFPPFAFQRTDDGIKIVDEWKPASKKPAVNIDAIPDEVHKKILAEVFKSSTEHNYSDLVNALQASTMNTIGPIGIGKAKQLITLYYAKKMVTSRRDGQKSYYFITA